MSRGSCVVVEEALLDEKEVNEVMSDRGTSPGEPDTETAGDRSDVGAVLGEIEGEAADSEVQASSDVSRRKAIADGSDMLELLEEEEELWLSMSSLVVERRGVLGCYLTLLWLAESEREKQKIYEQI